MLHSESLNHVEVSFALNISFRARPNLSFEPVCVFVKSGKMMNYCQNFVEFVRKTKSEFSFSQEMFVSEVIEVPTI